MEEAIAMVSTKSPKTKANSSIRRRRFLELLVAACGAGKLMGRSLAVCSDPPGGQTPRLLSGPFGDTSHARKPLIRDVKVGYLLNYSFWCLSPYINPADIRLSGW